MNTRRFSARSGFTLIEILIVITLLGLILAQVTSVMRTSTSAVSRESSTLVMQDRARVVLDRIALAIMACDRRSLGPLLGGVQTPELNYQVCLGVENGKAVWDSPERISQGGAQGSQVVWVKAPALPDERRVVWSNRVRAFLDGEIPNGIDDNGNGLIDEKGLSFVVEGNKVTIRLSLERTNEDGSTATQQVETTVTVRNNPLTP